MCRLEAGDCRTKFIAHVISSVHSHSCLDFSTATKDPGQEPFSFQVGMGQVIKGWDESVIDMSLGEVSKIHCSPDYAYGSGGFPAWGIMPNSELIFEIEVLSYQ
jgi:FKBP-type peptidyl-prolyl cis-trans isomerase 2